MIQVGEELTANGNTRGSLGITDSQKGGKNENKEFGHFPKINKTVKTIFQYC